MTYTNAGRLDVIEIIKKHTPLVKKLAYLMMARLPANVDVNDLIQVGLIGLYDAAARFDPTQGIQFETFVSQRIRGAMLDDLRANDWVSRGVRKTQKDISKTVNSLEQLLGRNPSDSEIASGMNISLVEYHELLSSIQGSQLLYLEDLSGNSDDDSGDYLDKYSAPSEDSPFKTLTDKRMRGALINAINTLPEREQQIMQMYYVEEMNLKEIAATLAVTESRVSQLHSQVIVRLRAKMKSH